MTVKDPTNEWYSTSQQSALTASPRRGVVLHHGATTSVDAIISMETTGSRQVSSNRAIKDLRCAKIVDEFGVRAWSLSSAKWDSLLRSAECANESTAGWTLSAATHETAAQMVAFWAQQDGFWPSRSGPRSTWTVFGHREIFEEFGDSYATACPGGMDLDWITTRSQAILTNLPTKKEDDMDLIRLTSPTNTYTELILTDYLHKRVISDKTGMAAIMYLRGHVDVVSDAANYAWLKTLPDFGDVPLTDAQLAKIGAAVPKVDLSDVINALKVLPELIVTRLRTFWSTGK